jgi:hypothetical protein
MPVGAKSQTLLNRNGGFRALSTALPHRLNGYISWPSPPEAKQGGERPPKGESKFDPFRTGARFDPLVILCFCAIDFSPPEICLRYTSALQGEFHAGIKRFGAAHFLLVALDTNSLRLLDVRSISRDYVEGVLSVPLGVDSLFWFAVPSLCPNAKG